VKNAIRDSSNIKKSLKMHLWFFLTLSIVNAENIGNFIQLTDIHYDQFYTEGAPTNCVLGVMKCCKSSSIPLDPPGKANKFGEYVCDTSPLLFTSMISWIKQNLEFDYVIYTGDSVSHYDLDQNWPINFQVIQTVTNLLQTLEKPVYSVLGNHDSGFVDQLYGLDPVVTDVARVWENDTLTNNASIRNFGQGGYYKSHNICGLNSLWYDKNNLLLLLNETYDWFNQYDWAGEKLDNCTLISHIFPTAGTDKFNQFMLTVKPRYQLYGHSHTDKFIIYNDLVSWIAPSIVPDGHDPSIRLFQYDRDTGTILDYQQYTLNLTQQQKNDSFLGLELKYSARLEYDLKDMSSDTWWDLAKKMKNNATLLSIYCSHLGSSCTNALCDINPSLC